MSGLPILTSAGSNEPKWLLTAGHLLERGAQGARLFAAMPNEKPQVVGHPVINLLEDLPGVLPLDAALVELTPKGKQLAKKTVQLPTVGVALGGWGDADVRMLRPTTNSWARSRTQCSRRLTASSNRWPRRLIARLEMRLGVRLHIWE